MNTHYTPEQIATAKAERMEKWTPEQIALTKAVDLLGEGNNTAAAQKIGISHSTLWTWRNRNKKAPAEICRKIEALTNFQVTRQELRPDVFGESKIHEIAQSNLSPMQRLIATMMSTIETDDPDVIVSALHTFYGLNAKEALEHYKTIKQAGIL